jgi:biopolymer transport protein ExbD
MKLRAFAEEKRARIEIIPLIDIMFFLLACFMVMSLTMIHMRGIKVNLPGPSHSDPVLKKDFTKITVTSTPEVFLEAVKISDKWDLLARLKTLHETNEEMYVYVAADQNTIHGEVIDVLDAVRGAGITKVGFELKRTTQAPHPE